MKKSIGLALALAILGAGGADASQSATLDWLSGRWVQEDGGRWAEESWSDARGGVLLGTSKTGHDKVLTGFEFMRIAPDKQGRVHFYGSPQGTPGVAFRLVSSGERSAVFENPLHDYPQRISYRREGDVLTATISDIGGNKAVTWRFQRTQSR